MMFQTFAYCLSLLYKEFYAYAGYTTGRSFAK